MRLKLFFAQTHFFLKFAPKSVPWKYLYSIPIIVARWNMHTKMSLQNCMMLIY
jgi:hypothetical protein